MVLSPFFSTVHSVIMVYALFHIPLVQYNKCKHDTKYHVYFISCCLLFLTLFYLYLLKFYLFIFREREGERGREISVRGCFLCPQSACWGPGLQLRHVWELNLLPFGSQPVLNPLSYISQGLTIILKIGWECNSSLASWHLCNF